MAITVTHSKVSTIPDGDDSSLIRPSDWNDDHVLAGLGTMAEQNANSVSITGGSISGTTVSGYIPTSAEGVANGVATLDSGGTVPLNQIPASIIGGLNYQGSWNANTNTPTLTSSVGTKGYYYVVSVAGTTNLNGITDWQAGDLAVYNGSAWQKIDNTDAVTSVNGYTGTVVLTYSDVGAFPATATTGTGNVVLQTNPTVYNPNIDVIDFDTNYATTLTAGQLGWDGNNTLALGMAGGNVIQHIGEDLYFYYKATSAVTKGQVVMFTGAVGASGVPTGAPATGITDGTYIMGIAAESVALNGFGLVQSYGELRNINTTGYADGDILWYNPAVTGGLTKTKPSAPNVKVQMAAVINGGSSGGGTILIRIDPGSTLGGTDSNAQIATPTNGQLITYDNAGGYWKNTNLTAGTGMSVSAGSDGTLTITNTSPSSGGTVTSVAASAGTGISVTGSPITSSGTLTITNTAPDQVVSLTAGTGISTSGTYPSFTVTNTAPDQTVAISSGTGISVTGTYPNFTVTNTSPSSGGTVTSVTATSPVTSTGGTTPVIAMPAATGSVNGYLTSTDWTTFNNKATLPSQTGNSGKYLTTDGSSTSWGALPTYLPVTNRSSSIIQVSTAYGYCPVLTHGGSTTNVPIY